MTGRPLLGIAVALIGAAVCDAARAAAEPGAADAGWMDSCMADRGVKQFDPVKLREYCSCMYESFADNKPLTPNVLERIYPPANARCIEESGVLR
ncbi:MAG: hypothetical protein ACRECX_14910 [Methyloceanibacter sp.]|uniref:hypothetical protein n=1 Tax=Methyloceanibacter sp. TaxID=1965321 RepID=UPI003D6C8C2D